MTPASLGPKPPWELKACALLSLAFLRKRGKGRKTCNPESTSGIGKEEEGVCPSKGKRKAARRG